MAECKPLQDPPVLRSKRYKRVGEIQFTSERKMMSTLEVDHAQGEKVIPGSKGAPDVLLEKCTHVQTGQTTKLLDDLLRARILKDVATVSDAALRTLAVAYRPLDAKETRGETHVVAALEHCLVYVGTVGMMDSLREEAAIAITIA